MKTRLVAPGRLQPAGRLRTGDGDHRRWPWALLALALLIALIAALLSTWERSPESLADAELTGSRGPGCVRMIVVSDQSGSMRKYARPREAALAQFLEWVPSNLRADDELSVVGFTDHARNLLDPTPVPALPAVASQQLDDGQYTRFRPVIESVSAMPASPCRSVLAVLSDGLLVDLDGNPEAARTELRDIGVDELFLLVPDEEMKVGKEWQETYPYAAPQRFDGDDSDATGLVFGNLLAGVTGQELSRR